MELHAIGIDLGKTLFHLVGVDACGNVVVRKRCSRTQLLTYTANLRVQTNRHGSLQRGAFPGTGFARTGSRRAVDAGAVREALREDEQERLH